ncbi:MAG: hypothetical protein QM765_14315 [Myxococcales bacterium]
MDSITRSLKSRPTPMEERVRFWLEMRRAIEARPLASEMPSFAWPSLISTMRETPKSLR